MEDRFIVLTRKWESATLKVYVFSAELHPIEARELELGGAFPGLHVGVNAMVDIEERPFLITAVFNGPPIDGRFSSYIAAIGLDESLSNPGLPIVLSRTEAYEGWVSCARYVDGVLFVAYDVLSESEHKGMVKAFDPANGFRELGAVQINAGRMPDNHLTLEVFRQTLYVFYQTPGEELRAKVLSIRAPAKTASAPHP